MRSLLLAIALMLGASPARAQDYSAESAAAADLRDICAADAGALWGVSLCGPLIVVDPQTRQAWATQRDASGAFTITADGAWRGALPAGVPIANTAVDWDGVTWIMVVGPLPADATERRVLVMHEAWHRIQASLGLPMQNVGAAHLESERARYLIRLEFRALATAMLSNGRARRIALRDALTFRRARFDAFPEAAATETALDRHEGLAAYTGVALGAGESAAGYASRALIAADQSDSLARTYAYATGPAYGLMLDELQPGWRTALEAWAPADLLVGPARVQPLSNRDLERRAARYSGAEIAAQERARAERQAEIVTSLRARFAGPRLELPLVQMQIEYDPNTVTPIARLGSVYGTLVVRDVWGEVRVNGGALINEDFTHLSLAGPGPDGRSGAGWALALAPGYRIGVPDLQGVLRPEPIPVAPPAVAPASPANN